MNRTVKLSLVGNRTATSKTLLFAAMLVFTIGLGSGCASQQKPEAKKAAFWPPYPDEPRLQYLVSFTQSTDVAPKKTGLDELVYGKEVEQVLAVKKPYGIKMYNGRIYVCDLRNACVTVLDLRKQQTLILGRTGNGHAANSHRYRDCRRWNEIRRRHRQRADLRVRPGRSAAWEAWPTEMKPSGIAVFQNELFVCDFKSQRVLVLDRTTGALRRTIGQAGSKPGQFIRPLGIAVDQQGSIYVVDVMKCQMQKFTRDGKLVTNFGAISANAGGFVRPKHIAVDKDGQIYVVDAAFQNVQVFDQVGRPLTFFGSAGDHPGAMYLPAGITVTDADLDIFSRYVHPAFEAQRLVLVTNQFGDNKISVYAFGHLKPGKTPQDIAGSQGLVPAGTGEQRTKGPGAPLTAPVPPEDDIPAPTTRPGTLTAAPPPRQAAPAAVQNNAAPAAVSTPAAAPSKPQSGAAGGTASTGK